MFSASGHASGSGGACHDTVRVSVRCPAVNVTVNAYEMPGTKSNMASEGAVDADAVVACRSPVATVIVAATDDDAAIVGTSGHSRSEITDGSAEKRAFELDEEVSVSPLSPEQPA